MTSVHITMAFLLGIHIAVSFILKCFNRTKNVREVKTRVEMSMGTPGSERRVTSAAEDQRLGVWSP